MTETPPEDWFESLPPADKRIQIAKDVLDRLDTHRLNAQRGNFVYTDDFFVKDGEVEVRDKLAKKASCTVCALGSLFVCAVDRADALKIKDLKKFTTAGAYLDISGEDVDTYLSRFFERDQIALMEIAFERGGGYFGGNNVQTPVLDKEAFRRAVGFADLVYNESFEGRLRRIMNNLIDNDGVFIP